MLATPTDQHLSAETVGASGGTTVSGGERDPRWLDPDGSAPRRDLTHHRRALGAAVSRNARSVGAQRHSLRILRARFRRGAALAAGGWTCRASARGDVP